MINTQTLARPYAKAAFEFASAAGQTDSWSKMLNLAAVAVEVPEVAALLNDPRLTSESKVQALVRVLGDDADEAFRNYVQTLGENDRLSVLPTVWELYEDIKAVRKPWIHSRSPHTRGDNTNTYHDGVNPTLFFELNCHLQFK